MPFITFISPPPGQAPDEVRRAWVGVTVPVTTHEARLLDRVPVVGVRSGPYGFWRTLWGIVTRRVETWRGYSIESRKCLAHLRDRAPDAAAWWAENAPRFLEPRRCFVFPAECCELRRTDWIRSSPQEPGSAATPPTKQRLDHWPHMSTLRLKSSNSDTVVEFFDVEGDFFRVSVISCDHSATRGVHAYTDRAGIARLFADAAKEWRGWQEPKVWESLGGELRIELSIDNRGHVTVAVRVRSVPGRLDSWQLDAELGLDAGQLDAVARDANRLWSEGG